MATLTDSRGAPAAALAASGHEQSAPSPPRPPRALLAAGLAAAGAFALSFVLLHLGDWAHHQLLDTPLYEAYADSIRAGDLPYRNFHLEYPPGALVAFLAPELTVGSEQTSIYSHVFEIWMAGCGVALTLLVAAALAALHASLRRSIAALALVGVSPLLLGPVIMSRFDLWPALLLLAALLALLLERPRLGAILLACAISAKLYPLVCLPVALIWVAKRSGRREALVFAGLNAAVLAAIFGPFTVLAPQGMWRSFAVQLGRPLQVESLGAALLVAVHHLAGLHLFLHEDHGSRNIEGTLPNLVGDVSSLVDLLALGVVYLRYARGSDSRERLVAAVGASVVVFIAFGKVFSPQYMTWFDPADPSPRRGNGPPAPRSSSAAR